VNKSKKYIEEHIEQYIKINIGDMNLEIDMQLKHYVNLCIKETVMSYVRDKKYKDIEKHVTDQLDSIFEKGY